MRPCRTPIRPRVAYDLGADLPIDVAFLRTYGSPSLPQLRRAQAIAERDGTAASASLIADRAVSELLFYRALADHLQLPFVQAPGPLACSSAPGDAIRNGRVALAAGASAPWLLAPTGADLKALVADCARGRAPPDAMITTPTRLAALVRNACRAAITADAHDALRRRDATLCAKDALDRRVLRKLAVLGAALCVAIGVAPHAVASLAGLLFFTAIIFRLVVCAYGLVPPKPEPPPLPDADLPLYSVLVPLRGEAGIVARLIERLDELDYPRAKLEIKILVEEDDAATQLACFAARLGPHYEIIVAPDGKPRTKPRALNVALPLIKGVLVTVYDAEDAPDRDQLRKAAARFHATPDAACLQARLAIRNGGSCRLARLFALDYAGLFDLYNPGLAECGLPMALGGTSNHFRTAVLRAVGGWDAWNVAEDADLGFRLARFGHRTEALWSTTAEDAPTEWGNWLRQRRRWTKGWMQTALVLARDPRRLVAQLGPGKALAMGLMLTMLVVAPLASLPLTVFAAIRLALYGLPAAHAGIEIADATLWVWVFVAGPASTLWTGYAGARARGLAATPGLLLWLIPYQAMISVAAWGGLIDLCRNPYHWHKTQHGTAPAGRDDRPRLVAQKRTGRPKRPSATHYARP